MFMLISVPKIYPARHTDDNRNKQGSNLTVADKRVAELFKAEYWDIKKKQFRTLHILSNCTNYSFVSQIMVYTV